jgi:DNA-directed RNA polymerase subunit RPC12/RpoP
MKNKANDIEVKMYVPFSCVDCGQEFRSRQELIQHESSQR